MLEPLFNPREDMIAWLEFPLIEPNTKPVSAQSLGDAAHCCLIR
jgi:hypothetical protein